jgi:hypothetical protein
VHQQLIRDKSVVECPFFVLYNWNEIIQGREYVVTYLSKSFDPLFTYFHVVVGSCMATHKLPHIAASSKIYVKYPPKMSLLTVKAKSYAAAPGPTLHWIETTVCVRPLVAPRDCLLGAAEHTYMNTEPYESQRSFQYSSWIENWGTRTETHVSDKDRPELRHGEHP